LARIKHCLALGVSTFDLADIYGGGNHQAEACFGEALRLEPELRTQMQLVTKCGIVLPEGNAPKHYDTSPEYIRRRVEESLRAVGTTYFDVLLIHRPDPFMDAQQVCTFPLLYNPAAKTQITLHIN
jgi:predicted oxidoreductase